MSIALIVGIIILALFVLAFITKRRFGVLGLALAAGAMLSNLWTTSLTPLVAQTGVIVEQPPLETLVAAALVLLPAVLLLFSGPSYHDKVLRIVGAACFALLAGVFLIEPIGGALVLMDQNKQVYEWMLHNRVYIVTIGLVLAIIDLLSVHTGIGHKAAKRGKH